MKVKLNEREGREGRRKENGREGMWRDGKGREEGDEWIRPCPLPSPHLLPASPSQPSLPPLHSLPI